LRTAANFIKPDACALTKKRVIGHDIIGVIVGEKRQFFHRGFHQEDIAGVHDLVVVQIKSGTLLFLGYIVFVSDVGHFFQIIYCGIDLVHEQPDSNGIGKTIFIFGEPQLTQGIIHLVGLCLSMRGRKNDAQPALPDEKRPLFCLKNTLFFK